MLSYKAILPEDVIQRMVFDWAETVEYRYPCLRLMYHTPNEGKRSKSEGGKLKRMGLRRGVPDICPPVARGRYHGLYIELKSVGGTVRREQKEYLEALRSEGYCTAVCRSAEECESFITEYLRLGSFAAEVE